MISSKINILRRDEKIGSCTLMKYNFKDLHLSLDKRFKDTKVEKQAVSLSLSLLSLKISLNKDAFVSGRMRE